MNLCFLLEYADSILLSTEKKIRIDESDQGLCYFCGKPAGIKVGLWSSLEQLPESVTQNWREVLICRRCNETHNWVDEEGLPDTYVGY